MRAQRRCSAKNGRKKRVVAISDLQSLVGSLIWFTRCTRLNIAFAVHKAIRRTHSSSMDDLKLAKRIIRYLARTRELRVGIQDKTY